VPICIKIGPFVYKYGIHKTVNRQRIDRRTNGHKENIMTRASLDWRRDKGIKIRANRPLCLVDSSLLQKWQCCPVSWPHQTQFSADVYVPQHDWQCSPSVMSLKCLEHPSLLPAQQQSVFCRSNAVQDRDTIFTKSNQTEFTKLLRNTEVDEHEWLYNAQHSTDKLTGL